jgi:hypothetical protein
MGSDERPDSEFWSFEESHGRQGAFRTLGRGLGTLVLGGLSSMEIIALAVLFIGVMGFLWMTDVVEPERLVTDATLSSVWAVMVLAVVRPITWVPYWLLFLGLQAMADAAAPRRSVAMRNLVGNLGAAAALGLMAWLVFVAIPESSTAVLSFLGFLTGAVLLEDLGEATGEWDALRVGAVVAGALLLRILIPPLGRDLDLSGEPILGFVSGARGRLDRVAVVVAVVGSVALGGIGLALGATGG